MFKIWLRIRSVDTQALGHDTGGVFFLQLQTPSLWIFKKFHFLLHAFTW